MRGCKAELLVIRICIFSVLSVSSVVNSVRLTFVFGRYTSVAVPRYTSPAKATRFAERRMRVDRLGHVADRAAHLDGHDRFGDQLARAGADDAAAQHAVGRRIDEPLGQPVGAADGDRPAAGLPRILRDRDVAAGRASLRSAVRPAQAISGSVNTTAGIACGSNAAGSPASTSAATLPSCDALWASIGSPATSPIARMCGSAVRCCSSTTTKPAVVDFDLRVLQADAARDRPAADRHQHAVERKRAVRPPALPSRTSTLSPASFSSTTFVPR